MQFVKFVSLFTKNNFLQLRRKWRSLPLLLLFPFLLIGLVAFVFFSYFSSLENDPIRIGLVDLDQSQETEMVMKLLEESNSFGDRVQMEKVTEDEAKTKLNNDQLVSYILFPDAFTEKLYNGESVVVTVVGNPNRQMESYLIKDLVDSAARHISSSQANILTINHYAKQLNMDTKTRNQLVQEQFNEFLMYAIGKDQALSQNIISNNATSSPKEYFGLAAGFFILSVWILIIYQLLSNVQSKEIRTRMLLYGVTELQQMIARIIIAFFLSVLLGILLFIVLINLLDLSVSQDNYSRVFYLLCLFSLHFLFTLAILEMIIPSKKLYLLVQIVFAGLLLFASGSLIPEIYLPLYVQETIPYIFSNQTFHWLEEIVLNERNFVAYNPILLSLGISGFIMVTVGVWKECVRP